MSQDAKIDEMNGLLHEMKPMLAAVVQGQERIDARVRAVELRAEGHNIQITRIQSDLDHLGRKVRSRIDTSNIRGEVRGSGRWLSILEFLSVAPTYWHVLLSLGMGVITVVTLLWRRHGP